MYPLIPMILGLAPGRVLELYQWITCPKNRSLVKNKSIRWWLVELSVHEMK